MDVLDEAFKAEILALEKWGPTAQRLMVAEEASELVVAVTQHGRGRITDSDLLDEAADAVVVACAAAILGRFGPGALRERVRAKLDRLQRRLAGEAGHGAVVR